MSCVYFTNTRSGLAIGVVFGVLLLSLRYLVWLRVLQNQVMAMMLRLQLMWLPILAAGGAYVLADLMAGRSAAERSSSSSRLLTLVNAFDNIGESPLIGFGVGLGDTKGGTSYAGGYMYTVDNLFCCKRWTTAFPLRFCCLPVSFIARGVSRLAGQIGLPEDVGLRVGLCS